MDTLEATVETPKLVSIGWTNVWWSDASVAQRTTRSKGNHHERKEPVKVYRTEANARVYAEPGFRPAEVFVEQRIRDDA